MGARGGEDPQRRRRSEAGGHPAPHAAAQQPGARLLQLPHANALHAAHLQRRDAVLGGGGGRARVALLRRHVNDVSCHRLPRGRILCSGPRGMAGGGREGKVGRWEEQRSMHRGGAQGTGSRGSQRAGGMTPCRPRRPRWSPRSGAPQRPPLMTTPRPAAPTCGAQVAVGHGLAHVLRLRPQQLAGHRQLLLLKLGGGGGGGGGRNGQGRE